MKEIWKDIPNYENLYQASNLGKIKNKKNSKKIKTIQTCKWIFTSRIMEKW